MGVSPKVQFAVCITDGKKRDPRFNKAIREKNCGEDYYAAKLPVMMDEHFDLMTGKHEKDKDINKNRPEVSEVIVETEDGKIVGYEIDGRGGDLAYGIALALGSHFEGKKYIPIPSLDPKEHEFRYQYQSRQSERAKKSVDLAIQEGRWIDYYDGWYTDLWFKKAIAFLHFIGWAGVTRDMLKIILVLDWS